MHSQGGGDLDRSIGAMEDALALMLVGHAARSQALTGLGMSCFMWTRHRQGRGRDNVRTFIEASQSEMLLSERNTIPRVGKYR